MKHLLQHPYIQHHLYKNTRSRAFIKLLGIVIQELKMCAPQFLSWKYPVGGAIRTCKYALQALIKLFLGRSISYSYSFTVEDRIIESLVKPLIYKPGYYVDVGCNEPRFMSNSFLFYKRGWRGLCIDANETLIAKHKRIRPRDRAYCAVISDKEEEVEFGYSENPGLSSADVASRKQYEDDGIKTLKAKVRRTETLTQIFLKHNVPAAFDFLSIDIEGNDIKALQGLDLSLYQPKLIILEWEDFNLNKVQEEAVYTYLSSYNYRFEGYLLTNAYFLKVNENK